MTPKPSVGLNSRDTFLSRQAELSSTSPALSHVLDTKKIVFQDPSRKDPERRTTFTLSQTRYEKLQLLVTKQKCSRLAAGNHNHPFAAKPDTDELNSKGSIQIVETRVPSIQNPGKNDCPMLLKWVERLKRYCSPLSKKIF